MEIVRVLFERGADANAQDVQGSNPMRMALGGGHGKVARLLLRNGADAGARKPRTLCAVQISGRLAPTMT